MTSNERKIIGPYKIKDLYYKEGTTYLYNIEPNTDDPSIDFSELNGEEWIMKVKYNVIENDTEIDTIERYEINTCKYAVKMPKNRYLRRGRLHNGYWLIMKKYDGSGIDDINYIKKNIKKFGIDILNFLEWLHCAKGKIHGDIKLGNILIDYKQNNFILADYELIDQTWNELCFEDLPNGYYYYSLGCGYNKPYKSFRMDLEALGYILYQLILSKEKLYEFKWQKLAVDYYRRNTKVPMFGILEFHKANEKYENEFIYNYFTILDDIGWFDKSPEYFIYEDLRQLFLNTTKFF
jgi:serine/threonine protein kinase